VSPRTGEQALLEEQKAYYRARAREYDAWWFRRGRYDRGPEANARWFAEVALLEEALERFRPGGDVLELACGTGLWTRHLVRYAARLTAVDASEEVIAINRARVDSGLGAAPDSAAAVEYVQADLFEWTPPPAAHDVCFFGFWLSHVPESRFEAFWSSVRSALRPGGRVFFVDSARSELSGAGDHVPPGDGEEMAKRRLDDGREFTIVKRFYEPGALASRLAALGWDVAVRSSGEFFIYGEGARTRGPADLPGPAAG
jgi:SAM-dependent methyltransferase